MDPRLLAQIAQATTPMDIYLQQGLSPKTSMPQVDLEVIRQTDPQVGQPKPASPTAPPQYKTGGSQLTQGGLKSLEAMLRARGMPEAAIQNAIRQYQQNSGLRVVP